MERLTKRSPETTNENGVCCTHFHSPECFMVEGNCSAGCKWEEAAWSRLAAADKNGRVVVLPRWKNEEERLERQRLMRIMADGAIDRLMENPLKEESGPDIAELRVVNTDRLLELAKADEDGRIFLLPMEPGRSMLCQEYFERPWVMKNVTLCVQYQSSAGIIFYMGYDVFRGLVERGRITPLSQEGEEILEGKANV